MLIFNFCTVSQLKHSVITDIALINYFFNCYLPIWFIFLPNDM